MIKRTACVLLLALALFFCSALAESVDTTVASIQKYGNLILTIPASEFLEKGYAYGDVITAGMNGTEYEMPVCSSYADVDQGSLVCRVVLSPEAGSDAVILAINMGDLATTSGIATKETIDADPGFVWHTNEGVAEPVSVTLSIKDPSGYYEEWFSHQLVRSNNREDYPNLSDEEFANFRSVATSGIASGRLYRSSSPVDPKLSRNVIADNASEAAGIKTIINLDDNEETMKAKEGYAGSYYSEQTVLCLNLNLDISSDEFREGLAKSYRFITRHDGPYLIHCNEGKDRAGFACAVLECLMGASAEEVTEDYMKSFFNYYGIEPGTEAYDTIASRNICKSLAASFGVEDIADADLSACAETYLLSIGLTADEINAVRAKLAK